MRKMNFLLAMICFAIAVIGCSKNDTNEPAPTPTPTPTPVPTPTPTPPAEKKATALVTATATGIALTEVQVVLSETSFTPVNGITKLVNTQERDFTAEGKASFDVKNYIANSI